MVHPHHPPTIIMRNSNTKRYKSGNPALLSAHFADAVSPEIVTALNCPRGNNRPPIGFYLVKFLTWPKIMFSHSRLAGYAYINCAI
jgi:hypothetical protein